MVGGKLKLAKLGKAEEPKLMPPFRHLVNSMLPTQSGAFRGLLPLTVAPLKAQITCELKDFSVNRDADPSLEAQPGRDRSRMGRSCGWAALLAPASRIEASIA
jgi:hypothetical protein